VPGRGAGAFLLCALFATWRFARTRERGGSPEGKARTEKKTGKP